MIKSTQVHAYRCLFIALLIPYFGYAAEIHKWRDTDGKIHFGDKPPATVKSEQITVKPNVYASPSIEGLSEIFSRDAKSHDEKIVMYGTTWCGYCKKARNYFSANGIRYKEYDIENSEKGKRDYKKLGAKGIPVILVGKKRLNGFSEDSFKRIYTPKQD